MIKPQASSNLFKNLSDDYDSPMCLMASGTKVLTNPPPSPTSSATSSDVEDDEGVKLKQNMINEFGKKGYKQIKKLMKKLEKKRVTRQARSLAHP